MYAEVTKLINCKHSGELLQKINRLKPLKSDIMCQVVCYSSYAYFITVRKTLVYGWLLYVESIESGIVLLVGSIHICRSSYFMYSNTSMLKITKTWHILPTFKSFNLLIFCNNPLYKCFHFIDFVTLEYIISDSVRITYKHRNT